MKDRLDNFKQYNAKVKEASHVKMSEYAFIARADESASRSAAQLWEGLKIAGGAVEDVMNLKDFFKPGFHKEVLPVTHTHTLWLVQKYTRTLSHTPHIVKRDLMSQ